MQSFDAEAAKIYSFLNCNTHVMMSSDERQPLLPKTNNCNILDGSQADDKFSTVSCSTTSSCSNISASSACEPATLVWRNLNVEVKQTGIFSMSQSVGEVKTNNQILKNVNGILKPGQLVALMGASGAGKTTLLNTLTQRNINRLHVSGDILVNGVRMGREITSVSAYVQQDDIFIGAFTVSEHLSFQAMLRLPKTMSTKQKKARVEEVMQNLGLVKCKNTLIGTPGEKTGVSGGEAKRLSFASEILINPSILFCDEPTTGLDSYTAENIVDALHAIARSGRSVLCTIHQPPSEIFAKFNHIMLLANGRLAYYGTTKKALNFFQSQGYSCPQDFNPADYLIKRLAITPNKEAKCKRVIKNICDAYEASLQWTKYLGKIQGFTENSVEYDKQYISNQQETLPITAKLYQLFWRAELMIWRARHVTIMRIAQKVFMSIFVGLLYLRTPLAQGSVMDINGALYFMLMALSMTSIITNLRSLPAEFPILIREHHSGMYGVILYYISKVFSIIPLFAIDGIVFMTIVFWLIGLHPTVTSFFGMLAVAVLIEEVSCAFGVMLSTVSPSFSIALSIAGPIMTLVWVTGGLFANVGTLPAYISWIQYLSWWRLGFELLASFQWQQIYNIPCDRPFNITCFTDGNQVLHFMSFSTENIGLNFGLLFVMLIGFYIIGGIGLKFRAYRHR